MLMTVRVPLFGDWSVMYCALPSDSVPWSFTRRAIVLSTKIAVPTLNLCEVPIGIPSFQKEIPCQNLIPLPMLLIPSFPISMTWGGGESEANHALICFSL